MKSVNETVVQEPNHLKKLKIKQFDATNDNLLVYQENNGNLEFVGKENLAQREGMLWYIFHPVRYLKNFLLPKNYETTVTKDYVKFARWSITSSIFMTLSSIMSMQALLFAVGLSAQTALPMSAALNWILKDGLGQLGGMLSASFIHSKFDAHPRQWRFFAGTILDVAFLLETLTPMFPTLFLPIASITNIGKNIGWISASASRAAIHKSFMLTENLADITGKAGSQSIFASIFGTGLGLLIAPGLNSLGGYTNVYTDQPLIVLGVTASFCAIHLLTLRKSLTYVSVKTLDLNRIMLATFDKINVLQSKTSETSIRFEPFRSPTSVSCDENIISSKCCFPEQLMQYSLQDKSNKNSNKEPLLENNNSRPFSLSVSPSLKKLDKHTITQVSTQLSASSYALISEKNQDICSLLLLFREQATSKDVLEGILATKIFYQLENKGHEDRIELSKEYAAKFINQYLSSLKQSGWEYEYHFMELYNRRIVIEPSTKERKFEGLI